MLTRFVRRRMDSAAPSRPAGAPTFSPSNSRIARFNRRLDPRIGSLGDAMASYWAQFGTWTSCARDLRPYCDAIVRTDPGVAKALGDKFVEEANALPEAEGGSDGKEAQRRLRRVIAAHAISAQLGQNGGSWRVTAGDKDVPPGLARPSLGHCEGRARAATAMHLYRNSKPAFAGPDPREPTPADTAALLATQALCAEATGHAVLAAKGNDESAKGASLREAAMSLLAAAAVAEEGIGSSPNHAELRLGLSSVYALLGAATAARDVFAPIDIKNIQMDSMIHHILPIAEGGAAPQVTFRVTQFADNLRNEVRRDIPEGCVKAYENGVYTKALEYVDFHERLRASHSAAAATAAKVRATLREMSCGGGADVGAVPAGRAGPGDGRAGLRGDGVSIADCHVANREVQRGFGDQPRVGAADARVERARRPGLVAGSRRLGPDTPGAPCPSRVSTTPARAPARPSRTARVGARRSAGDARRSTRFTAPPPSPPPRTPRGSTPSPRFERSRRSAEPSDVNALADVGEGARAGDGGRGRRQRRHARRAGLPPPPGRRRNARPRRGLRREARGVRRFLRTAVHARGVGSETGRGRRGGPRGERCGAVRVLRRRRRGRRRRRRDAVVGGRRRGHFWKDFWKHIGGFWKDRGQPRARRRGQTRGGHYRGCHRQGRGRGDAQLCCIVGG